MDPVKIAQLKLILFDVDGVMTDGKLYFSDKGDAMKAFNSKDGLGLKMLQRAGIEVGIITGRKSDIVTKRAKELAIKHVYQGCVNKCDALEKCLKQLKLTPDAVAYMGDDINDIPVMRKVALGIAPANAFAQVQKAAHWVTNLNGGDGAVREVCDSVLKTQNKWDEAIAYYGN